jgi:hypothetical protein
MFRSVQAALTGIFFVIEKEKKEKENTYPLALGIPMRISCTRMLSTGSSVQ